MPEVIVVANEPPWPAHQGGRARVAGLVQEIAKEFEVLVAFPGEDGLPSSDAVAVVSLPRPRPRRLSTVFSARPRQALAILGAAGRERLCSLFNAHPSAVVLYTHSYLVPLARAHGHSTVVDFQNLETKRQASLARDRESPASRRFLARLDALKARCWEPVVAKGADLVTTVTLADAEELRRVGAEAVVVPNATRTVRLGPSPQDAPVTFLASATYEPNRAAGQVLLERIWPLVRARVPGARLRIAGRDSRQAFASSAVDPDVDLVGEVATIDPILQDTSVMIVPVTSGGGTQLKVVEALGRGRVVVGTPFTAQSVPAGAEIGFLEGASEVALADHLIRMLTNPTERWRREVELSAAHLPDWREAAAPLINRIRGMLTTGG